MRAICCYEHGGPEVLLVRDLPDPEPEPRDLLIALRAVSVNPVDRKVVSGARGPGRIENPPLIPGFDGSGVVIRTGGKCTRFKPGDEVYFAGDIGRAGCHAERVVVDERIVGRKPTRLTHAEASAIPLTALTAWESLIENLGAPEHGTDEGVILIMGGAGGVGSIAIQIAKKVCGLRVVATASRDESREFCASMGADEVVGHEEDPGEEFEYILSTATPTDIPRLADLLKPLGKIGFILPPPMPLDLSPLFPIRGSVSFELMFTRSRHDCEPQRQGEILDRVSALFDARILKSTVTTTLDWTDFREAYDQIGSGHTVGKIVMNVP